MISWNWSACTATWSTATTAAGRAIRCCTIPCASSSSRPVTTRSNGDELLVRSPVAGRRAPRGRRRRPSGGGRNPRAFRGRGRASATGRGPCGFATAARTCGSAAPGTGKSYHLKLLATEIHDFVEALTGVRTSRLVMLDASNFWCPYFGETEQRIARWAAKLEQLGSRALTTPRRPAGPLPADRVPGRSRIACCEAAAKPTAAAICSIARCRCSCRRPNRWRTRCRCRSSGLRPVIARTWPTPRRSAASACGV